MELPSIIFNTTKSGTLIPSKTNLSGARYEMRNGCMTFLTHNIPMPVIKSPDLPKGFSEKKSFLSDDLITKMRLGYGYPKTR